MRFIAKYPLWVMALVALIFHSGVVMSEKPESESIMLLLGEQDLTGCELLGKVSGVSQESDSDASYPERMVIARNQLRSETAKLGGNAVHVIHVFNTARYAIPGVDQKIEFGGNAYYCK